MANLLQNISTTILKTKFNADKSQYIEVKISTERNYFAITSTLYERVHLTKEEFNKYQEGDFYFSEIKEIEGNTFDIISSGSNHNEILKFYPEFKIFVDLHLSNVETGEPLHAYENGFYWFNQNRSKGIKYLRAEKQEFKNLSFNDIFSNMLPIWKAEAKKAIELINTL
jgi:hypothetical protein